MITKPTSPDARVVRNAHLRWIPIADMRVARGTGQRELNVAKASKIAAALDPERLGAPTVNLREGHWWLIDGQHRVEAMKMIGWEDQQIQCWSYEGLSEAEEAELFLSLNDTLTVTSFARFKAGVTAGREETCDINRVVLANQLVVSLDEMPGAVSAVSTLERVYQRSDAATLGRTLRIIRDAYGDPGLCAAVIDGIGHLCTRYNGQLEEPVAVAKLSAVHAGVNGLLGKAETIRRQTGNAKSLCVAAAAVEIINAGKGGKKLPSWWA